MKRLLIITLVLIAATAYSAGKQYYDYPDATVLNNTDRMLIYQNASGSRNLTGTGLKNVIYQTAWPSGTTRVFQAGPSSINSNMLVYAVRDRRGIIRRMQWEGGQQFTGVPGYNHTYVYPFNGMTNVSRTTPLVIGSYWLTRGFIGQKITIPGGPAFAVSALKYMGKINGLPNFDYVDYNKIDQSTLDAWYWGTSSVGTLAANTTYTIRSTLAKDWGGTNNMYSIGPDPCTYALANTSSARVMTNYSTVLCRSTFRTGSI